MRAAASHSNFCPDVVAFQLEAKGRGKNPTFVFRPVKISGLFKSGR